MNKKLPSDKINFRKTVIGILAQMTVRAKIPTK